MFSVGGCFGLKNRTGLKSDHHFQTVCVCMCVFSARIKQVDCGLLIRFSRVVIVVVITGEE